MSRADAKRSKQQRRAREDLMRGMRRRNLALVLEGFVGVLDEAPSAEVDEAHRWLASELRRALGSGDRRALEPWLAAGDRLPALVARLELDAEARWALFWAAADAQHWKAAELMLGELEPLLRERAADLGLAMSAIVTSRGRLELEHIPERMRSTPAAERLDGELPGVRPRRTSVPPATATDAERALVDCYATASWGDFSTLAQRWLRTKPEEALASAVGLTVAELACLELLRDLEGAKTGRRWAVVDLIVSAVSTLSPRSGEERERGERALLLGLRVVLGALTEPQAQRPPAGLVASAVRAGLAVPSLRDSIASAVTEIASREGAELSPQLLCELHELSPSPLLWASAVLALDAEQEQRFLHGRAPRRAAVEWLERTLTAHLADAGALQRSLSSLPPKRREELLSVLAASIAPALIADLCFALWPPPNDVQRRELADFAYQALVGHTHIDASFCVECGQPHARDFDGSFSELSAGGKALHERVGRLFAASDERFLSLALERTQQRSEQSDLLLAFAHDGAPIEQHVTALERALGLGLPLEPFRERLRARFAGRTAHLARGLSTAVERFGARSSTARELAEALLDADAAAPPSERSELVLTQLRRARRITGRKRQPRRARHGSPLEESTS